MPYLLVILGPTGVGKTDISLKLAERLVSPIVSSDSRQIYKELKIGTAAPSEEEMERVQHYFIGTHSIFDSYSAGQYEEDAIALLDELFKKNQVVILAGGSMMYIDAVCYGLDAIPTITPEVREFWLKEYELKGLEFIQGELKRLDPKHFQEVDLQNYKRILHALEVCSVSGKPYSQLRTGKGKKRDFEVIKIGLNRPRAELYERINLRVDQMIENGLLEEAAKFYPFKNLNSLNTVGYKEFYAHWDGEYDLDMAIFRLKRDTRRYAKRQLTWYRRDESVKWFHPDDEEAIFSYVESRIIV